MLIDEHHKGWFRASLVIALLATCVFYWFDRRAPGGLTGGSTVGLWYGMIGSALMVYAGLLSAHRRFPSWWWLGARKVWLRGHIWLGSLSALFILFHSGLRWGGPLEQVLWIVLILTLVSGVMGLVLQQVLPRTITVRIGCEAPFEQIPHCCTLLRRRADKLVDSICGDQPVAGPTGTFETATLDLAAKAQLREFYEEEMRPFLSTPYRRELVLTDAGVAETRLAAISLLPWAADVREPLALLGTLCDERRQLGEQERLHHLLHGWLLFHIPLSVGLLVLGLAHAALALYY